MPNNHGLFLQGNASADHRLDVGSFQKQLDKRLGMEPAIVNQRLCGSLTAKKKGMSE